jgi:hypothetical protein
VQLRFGSWNQDGEQSVCNLYSNFATQASMAKAFAAKRDNSGNVPLLPGIFPDQMAPVVRMCDGERELIQMRWSFPPTTEGRQSARHERPQRIISVLAGLAQAAAPLPRAAHQLQRVQGRTPSLARHRSGLPCRRIGRWQRLLASGALGPACAARRPIRSRASTCSTRS